MEEGQLPGDTKTNVSSTSDPSISIIESVLQTLQQRLAEAIGVNLSYAPLSEVTFEVTPKEKEKTKKDLLKGSVRDRERDKEKEKESSSGTISKRGPYPLTPSPLWSGGSLSLSSSSGGGGLLASTTSSSSSGSSGSGGWSPSMSDTLWVDQIRAWLLLPREAPFYGPLLRTLSHISCVHLSVLLPRLLHWMPQRALKDSPSLLRLVETTEHTPFAFTTFVRTIPNFKLTDLRALDIVELIVVLTVSDVLHATLCRRSHTEISRDLLEILAELAFNFFHPMQPRRLDVAITNIFNQNIAETWAAIFSWLSPAVLSAVSEFVGKTVAKATPEVQGQLLGGLRHLRLNLSTNETSEESKQLLSRLLPYIFLKDKSIFRSVPIEIFDSAFLSVSFETHDTIVEKARTIYKYLSKLAKSEELDGSAYRLMATILAHGPEDYFRKHAMTLVSKILLKSVWSSRRKDAALEALLRLLRGHYVPHTDTSPFAFAPFRTAFPDTFKESLRTIFDALFAQKNVLPRIGESIDICVEILLQMGAHSLPMLQSMLKELVASGHVWHHVLALRALRYLLDDTSLPSRAMSAATQNTSSTPSLTSSTLFWSHAVSLRDFDSKGNATDMVTQNRRDLTELLVSVVQRLLKQVSESLLDEVHARLHQSGTDALHPHPPTLVLFVPYTAHSDNMDTTSSVFSLAHGSDNEELTSSSDVVELWLRASSNELPLQRLLAECTPPRLRHLQEKFQFTLERLRLLHAALPEEIDNEMELSLQHIDQIVSERVRAWCATLSDVNMCHILDNLRAVNHYCVAHHIFEDLDIDFTDLKFLHRGVQPRRTSTLPRKKPINAERQAIHEVLRECLACYSLSSALMDTLLFLGSDGTETERFLAKLLLHPEEEIATICAHFLQHLMFASPPFCIRVVESFIALLLAYQEDVHTLHGIAQRTLLQHLLVLLDLWTMQFYLPLSLRSSGRSSVCALPSTKLLTKLECVALLACAHWSPHVRSVAVEIIHAVHLLSVFALAYSPSHFHISTISPDSVGNFLAKRVGDVWDIESTRVLQHARYHFLLQLTGGIEKDIRLNHNAPLTLTIDHIARSTHDTLWSYVLAEIGHVCISRNVPAITKLGRLLLARIKSLSATGLDALEVAPLCAIMLRNYRTLLFSGMSKDVPRNLLSKRTAASEKGDVFTETTWKVLLKESRVQSHSIVFAVGTVHSEAAGVVLESLWKWFTSTLKNSSEIKRRSKIRMDVASILRRVAEQRAFKQMIQQEAGTLNVYMEFIKEIASVLDDLIKVSLVQVGAYVLDNVLVVTRVIQAVSSETPCPIHSGPLRRIRLVHTAPDLLHLWPLTERYTLYSALFHWTNVGHIGAIRLTLDQNEVNKLLSRVKEAAKRDTKKDRCEKLLHNVYWSVLVAIEGLMKLDALIPAKEQRNLRKNIVDWMLPAERMYGVRLLRWALAYYWDETYPLIIDFCYGEMSKGAAFFMNAVFDQFLTLKPAPPTLGISDVVSEYLTELRRAKELRLEKEKTAQTKDDVAFAQSVSFLTGELLLLGLFALANPVWFIRYRALKFLIRLVPIEFGFKSQPNNELDTRLRAFKSVFQSRDEAKTRQAATQVAAVISEHCPSLTEPLFREIFKRFRTLQKEQKIWIVELMIPWLDHVVLYTDDDDAVEVDEGTTPRRSNLTRFAVTELLENVYVHVTLPLMQKHEQTQALMTLWLRVAQAVPRNLKIVIEFLLSKSLTDKFNQDICKLLILGLYRVNSKETLKHIVTRISVRGIIDLIMATKSPPATSMSQLSRESEDTPLAITISSSPSISRLRFSSHLRPVETTITSANSSQPSSSTKEPGTSSSKHQPVLSHRIADVYPRVGLTQRKKDKKSLRFEDTAAQREASYQIREITVSLLTDFAQENVQPLIPHLHVVFNYVLLRLDSNEGPNLVRLLCAVLVSVQRTLNASNDEAQPRWSELVTTLLTLCKTATLKVRWLCKEHATAFVPPPGASFSSDMHTLSMSHFQLLLNNGSLCTDTVSMSPQSSVAYGVPISTLLAALCEVGDILKCTDLRDHWAQEALLWAIDYKDLTLSTKALELYRGLIGLPWRPDSASTSQSLLPSVPQWQKMFRALEETLAALDQGIAEVVATMTSAARQQPSVPSRPPLSSHQSRGRRPPLSLLLTPLIPLNGSVSTPTSPRSTPNVSDGAQFIDKESGGTSSKYPPGSPTAATAPTRPVFPQPLPVNGTTLAENWLEATAVPFPCRTAVINTEKIALCTVRAQMLVQIWTQLIPHLRQNTPLLYLYWVAVALLQLSPFVFSHLVYDTLHLLRALLHSSVLLETFVVPSRDDKQQLKDECPTSLSVQLLNVARTEWGYRGLSPLLCRTVWCVETEQLGVELLCKVVSFSSESPFVVTTDNNSKWFLQHTYTVSLTLWLFHTLTFSDTSHRNRVKELATQLSQALSNNTELSALFIDYSQGKFDHSPIALIERVSTELVPHLAQSGAALVDVLREHLHLAPPMYTAAVMTLARSLLQCAPTYLPLFAPLLSDALKHLSEQDGPAQRLLDTVMAIINSDKLSRQLRAEGPTVPTMEQPQASQIAHSDGILSVRNALKALKPLRHIENEIMSRQRHKKKALAQKSRRSTAPRPEKPMTPLAVLLTTPLVASTTEESSQESIKRHTHARTDVIKPAKETPNISSLSKEEQLSSLNQTQPTTKTMVKHHKSTSQEKERRLSGEGEGGVESAERHTRAHSSSSNPTPSTPEHAGQSSDTMAVSDEETVDLSICEDILHDDEELEYLKQRLRFELDENETEQNADTSEESALSALNSLALTDPDKVFLKVFGLEAKTRNDDNVNEGSDSVKRERIRGDERNSGHLHSQETVTSQRPPPQSVASDTDLMAPTSIADALYGLQKYEMSESSLLPPTERNKMPPPSSTQQPSHEKVESSQIVLSPRTQHSVTSLRTPRKRIGNNANSARDDRALLQSILDKAQMHQAFKAFIEKNNMNTNILELLDAINDFKKLPSVSKAKMIMQRFFPKNVALAAVKEIPEPLRQEMLTKQELLNTSAGQLPLNFFENVEAFAVNHITRDYLPIFLKSEDYLQLLVADLTF